MDGLLQWILRLWSLFVCRYVIIMEVNIDGKGKGKGKGDGLVWISIDQSFIRDEDQGNRNATQGHMMVMMMRREF